MKELTKKEIKLLDVVALMKPISAQGLRKGQVGTVVEILDKGVFEVEFCDRQGRSLAILPVRQQDLLQLKYELVTA